MSLMENDDYIVDYADLIEPLFPIVFFPQTENRLHMSENLLLLLVFLLKKTNQIRMEQRHFYEINGPGNASNCTGTCTYKTQHTRGKVSVMISYPWTMAPLNQQELSEGNRVCLILACL